VDELFEAARTDKEKIQKLREQLDRLRDLAFAAHRLGGELLDGDVISHASQNRPAPLDLPKQQG